MAGSEANRTALGIVEEVTLGVTPANPAFESLRFRSTTLQAKQKTTISAELRADRQVTDAIRVGYDTDGDVQLEASYGALDTLFRGAFMSEWLFTPVRDNSGGSTIITAVSATAISVSAAPGTPTKYSSGAFAQGQLLVASGFTNAGNNRQIVAGAASSGTSIVITAGVVEAAPPTTARVKVVGFQGASGDIAATAGGLSATTLNFTTLGLNVGQWVKVGGNGAAFRFATAILNDWCRISVIAAGALTFDIKPVGWGVDAGAAKTISVFTGDVIRNGVIPRSYTIEKQFQDIAVPEFDVFTGIRVGSGELNGQAQSILQASVSLMGLAATNSTARTAGATDIAAPTNDVMNTSANVGTFYVNGAPVAGPNFVLGVKVKIDNTLRAQPAVASMPLVGIGIGRAMVTGELNMYYGNNSILTQIRNNSASSLAVRFTDPAGASGLLLDIPKLKFTDGDPTVSGVDTDRMLVSPIQGLRHTTLGYTIQLQRNEYFEV